MPIGFSETFPLQRELLAAAMRMYASSPRATDSDVAHSLGINLRKLKGVKGWLRALGWRDNRRKTLDDVGMLVAEQDPYLEQTGTLCLMHYCLVTVGVAEVWFNIVNDFLPWHREFTAEELYSFFEKLGLSARSPKHCRNDIRNFLNAYASRNALADISLLRPSPPGYCIQPVSVLPDLVLGYAIYDQREKGIATSTIAIDSILAEQNSVGRVFLLDRHQLISQLNHLELRGLVRINRIADLDNIAYTFGGNSVDILRMYYDEVH
ncbi:MAG: DUF4007 family protein [Chloroflexi bacterium]|nr:DUF4007 family protein [Chloroflexota bacterium]